MSLNKVIDLGEWLQEDFAPNKFLNSLLHKCFHQRYFHRWFVA
jgi:hypothetical protein